MLERGAQQALHQRLYVIPTLYSVLLKTKKTGEAHIHTKKKGGQNLELQKPQTRRSVDGWSLSQASPTRP
jgi:hypothetical protein